MDEILKMVFMFFMITMFSSPSIFSQEISVERDSIYMDVDDVVIPGNRLSLMHALKIKDKFYCVFREQSLHSYRKERKHFVSIDAFTKEIKWLSFPEEMNDAFYFDLYEKSYEIYLLDYHSRICYIYKPSSDKWVRKSNCNDIIYEDDEYHIAYQDHGEWGEYTWFLELESGNEYVIEENGEQVNKIDGKYYLTSVGKIIEISSPNLLARCKKLCYFTDGNAQVTDSMTAKFEYMYNDSISSFEVELGTKRRIYIESSWVWNDQLIQLYSTDTTTEIGLVRNTGIIPLAQLPNKVSIKKTSYSYRGNSNYNNSRFHHYRQNENHFGFIEINNGTVKLFDLYHNQDSLRYFNEDLVVSYWDKIYLLENELYIKDVKEFELASGGIKLNEDRSGPLAGLHPKELVTKNSQFISYIKIENKDIAQVVQYHFDDKIGEVKSIFIEWGEVKTYKTKKGFRHLFRLKELQAKLFEAKYDYLIQFVSEKTGVEPIIDLSSNYSKYATWKLKNNHGIRLSAPKKMSRNFEIRLVIF